MKKIFLHEEAKTLPNKLLKSHGYESLLISVFELSPAVSCETVITLLVLIIYRYTKGSINIVN